MKIEERKIRVISQTRFNNDVVSNAGDSKRVINVRLNFKPNRPQCSSGCFAATTHFIHNYQQQEFHTEVFINKKQTFCKFVLHIG